MTSMKFMQMAVPAALAVGLLALLLPAAAGARYAQVTQPVSLAAGGLLAVWVAGYYRASMRGAFLLIGGFLLLYSPVTWSWLVGQVHEAFDGNFLRVLRAYQVAVYALLLTGTVLVVRLMDVKRLSSVGWLVAAGGLTLAGVVIVKAVPTFDELWEVSREAGAIYLVIRIFDALVMTLMVPVIWLYVQNARAQYQENATFTLVAVGIVFSLVLVYLYELVRGEPLTVIATSEYQTGSVLDVMYLFGYCWWRLDCSRTASTRSGASAGSTICWREELTLQARETENVVVVGGVVRHGVC